MLSSLARRAASRSVNRLGATRGFAGKDIKFGVEGRAAMLKGVDTLADAVQVRSRNSVLYRSFYGVYGGMWS